MLRPSDPDVERCACLFRIIALTIWLILHSGCAIVGSGAPFPPAASVPKGGDTLLFSVAVQHLAADAASHDTSFGVDPRPLKADPSIVELIPSVARAAPDLVRAIPDPLADVSAEAVQDRSRVLDHMGVPAINVYAHASCPGMLEVPPDLRENSKPHPDCPAQAYTVAILGLPRRGGAYWPGSRIDERQQGGDDVWSVRMIQRHLEPTGVNMVASDVVVEGTSVNGWKVVKVVPLFVVE